MPAPKPLVARVLLDPGLVPGLAPAEWDLLVRQARRANVLGSLHEVLRAAGVLDQVPAAPGMHLGSAAAVSRRQAQATRWEVDCVLSALDDLPVPVVLLKGAAYVLAHMPAAAGRIFNDVDILVPPEWVVQVESRLLINGWQDTGHTPYDQRYYRRWMHEIPPLRHMRRGTVLDLHHALLPPTARVRADTPRMRAAATAVPGHPKLFVLSPLDMVLHSATHLFHEGELDNGFRDLFDLDRLLRHFAQQPAFWDELVARSVEVGLDRPLGLALRHAHAVFDTPVPARLRGDTAGPLPGGPIRRRVLDFCYGRTLLPHHASCHRPGFGAAKAMLYIRSHWLRMPASLLIPHLLRKAWMPAEKAER